MTLFAGLERERAERDRRARRTAWIGWTLVVLALVATMLLALSPAPYVIERPGPVFNTLGTTRVGSSTVPVIDIQGEKTYPTAGTLDMLTVSVVGDPQQHPSWLDLAVAWFDPSERVVPIHEVYPDGETVEQSNQQGYEDMQASQKAAQAAALSELGYSYTTSVVVSSVEKGAPADGVLRAGDTIVSVDGRAIDDLDGLRAAIAKTGSGHPVQIVVERSGTQQTVSVTPTSSGGARPTPVLGVYIGEDFRFPFEVKIQLQNVGGPSAGMMFALGIIDKLTPGELNGGQRVAGTGTIDPDGDVGEIGGIQQKMYGAARAGATWFLAPKGNCDEVVGHVPHGLRVFAVSTLRDARHVLETIADHGDVSALPTCRAAG